MDRYHSVPDNSHPASRHIVLVIFVTHESNEFSVSFGFGVFVVVSISGSESVYLASLFYKFVVKFTSCVAVVIRVRLLVSTSENCNLLSIKLKIGKSVVEPVIPRGSRALLISSSVPSRGSYNKSISSSNIVIGSISDIVSVSSAGFSDVSGNCLGVSSRSGVPDRSSVKRSQWSHGSSRRSNPSLGKSSRRKSDGDEKLHVDLLLFVLRPM